MKNSVIVHTGQTWKLAIAVLALLAGSILPAFPSLGMSWTVGTVLAFGGYGFGLLLIRCPDCGAHWFWDAIMRAELYQALFGQPSCPSCSRDFSGEDSSG